MESIRVLALVVAMVAGTVTINAPMSTSVGSEDLVLTFGRNSRGECIQYIWFGTSKCYLNPELSLVGPCLPIPRELK